MRLDPAADEEPRMSGRHLVEQSGGKTFVTTRSGFD
jgi:hypothetical protein